MPPPFDPYHRWLGITPDERRPINHYRLLGLVLFESGAEIVRDATERQLGHLRRYQAGSSKTLADELIAKVTLAQTELLNPTAKQLYDSALHSRNADEAVFVTRDGVEGSVSVSRDLLDRLAGHGFDPLHQWLGIPPREQPPTLYRLLGVQPFEADLDVIRENAERQIAHIRKYSLGERRSTAELLLRALAEARGQLSDEARKQVYDQRLKQLGSVVRRYASGAIEALSNKSQEAEPPMPSELASNTDTGFDPFELDELGVLPQVQALPTPKPRQHVRRLPAGTPYAVGGCGFVALLVVLLASAYVFVTRDGTETVTVVSEVPPVDSPGRPTTERQNTAPVTPQIAPPIELEPSRNGNPLLDYHRLSLRLEESGIDAVIEEYRDSSDADVELITKALDLSREVLRQDPSQLWSQLQARTVMSGSVPLSNFDQLRPTQPYWESLTSSFAQAGGPLLQTFTARPRPPLEFTSDGRWIVTCSHVDRLNRLDAWDLRTGKRIAEFSGHPEHVQTFAIAPNGQMVVSASTGVLKVWELKTGKELKTLTSPRLNIHSVAITPDGKTIVSGSSKDFAVPLDPIRVWDLETGVELRSFGSELDLNLVTLTPDGRTVISVASRELKAWDIADGRELYTFERVGTHPVVAISPNSQLIASPVLSGLKIWDLQNGSVVSTITDDEKGYRLIAFTADSSQLITSSLDETVKVWDVQSGGERKSMPTHFNTGARIAISPDRETIVSASANKTLLMSRPTKGAGPTVLGRTNDPTQGIAFASDNRTFATINGAKTVHIWDINGTPQQEFLPDLAGSAPVAISPDGRLIAYLAESETRGDRLLQLWDVDAGSQFRAPDGFGGTTDQLAFSPDGRTILSSFSPYRDKPEPVQMWTLDGKEWATLEGHHSSARRVAYTADGATIVSAGDDGTLKVWDSERNELRTLRGHTDRVHSVDIASDNRTIVSASEDGTIKVWNLQTGQQQLSLNAGAPVYGAKITPDVKSIAANVGNASLQVWDLETATLKQTHSEHAGPFLLTPDGKTVVSYNGSLVIVRDLKSGQIRLTVPAESTIAACQLLSDGQTLVLVETSGSIHRLRLYGLTAPTPYGEP